MEITIYASDGTPKISVSPSDSSTEQKEIQGDNVMSLSFKSYEFKALEVDDYIDFEDARYWLVERYLPVEISSVEWEYNVKFYGIDSFLKNILVTNMIDNDQSPVFTLTAPAHEHVAMIVKCLNEGSANDRQWSVGTVEGAGNITVDYKGKYCDEALREIAEAVDSEYWSDEGRINICRCEHGNPIELGYDRGLTEVEPDRATNVKFYTRLYPIGSSRNIDVEEYGFSRLQLPGGKKYVEINADKYGRVDHYEAGAFTEIYPRRIGTVSSVRSERRIGSDGNPFEVYYFTDKDMPFDPNDYEIGGLVKRVSFQEGSELGGLGSEDNGTYYFEVNYNSATKEFEIITIWPYDDDRQLPGGSLIPRVGDQYILWNIKMPKEYYSMAEKEFQQAVDEYNKNHWTDITVYKAKTDHVWIEQNNQRLTLGQRVRLKSESYFTEGHRDSRIIKITRNVNLPSSMELEIGDALSKTSLGKVTDDVRDARTYAQGLGEALNGLKEFVTGITEAFIPIDVCGQKLSWRDYSRSSAIQANKTLISLGDLQAFGYGGEASGTGGVTINLLNAWNDNYDETYALSADLGVALKKAIDDAEARVSVIENNYLSATDASKLYQPKGDYLTPQSLANYLTRTDADKLYQPKGNYLTAITKQIVESVLTGNITSHTHDQYLTSALAASTYLNAPELKFACRIKDSGTPKGYKIKTTWPSDEAITGNGMPTINIRGYAYGNAMPIDTDIVLYQYNGFVRDGVTHKGAWHPDIYVTREDGVVVLYIAEGLYYLQAQVYVYLGVNFKDSYAAGWTFTPIEDETAWDGARLIPERPVYLATNANNLGGIAASKYALKTTTDALDKKIDTAVTTLTTEINKKLSIEDFEKLFKKRTDSNGNEYIEAQMTLSSLGDFQAFGADDSTSGETSGGLAINLLDSWDKYNIATQGFVPTAKLVYNSLAGKADAVVLDSYAKTNWVVQQGYLTSSSLKTLTIQKNGTNVGTYKPDASSTINITDVASAASLTSHIGDTVKHITAAERTSWNNKVDKVSGKGLSTNDFTDALLEKLNGIAAGANKYVLPVATAAMLGGVIIGSSLTASATGVIDMPELHSSAQTYCKVSVDKYGRVTSGGTLVATDIPTLAISKISGLQSALDSKLNESVYNSFVTSYNTWKSSVDTTLTSHATKIAANTTSITNLQKLFNELFVKRTDADGHTYIEAQYTVSSKGDLQAFGNSATSGEDASIFNLLSEWSNAGSINSTYALSASLGIDLHKRLTTMENGGYATRDWVKKQKYLTEHQDISGLLSKTDAQALYLSKTGTAANSSTLDGYTSSQFIKNLTYPTGAAYDLSNCAQNAVVHEYRWVDGASNDIASVLDLSYSKDWRTQLFVRHTEKTELSVRSRYSGTTWGAWRRLAFVDDVNTVNSALSTHIADSTKHITAAERTKWNKVVTDFAAITGTDSDDIINRWEEVVKFLEGYKEADSLAKLLGYKADKTQLDNYLTLTAAASTYLTKTDAASTYITAAAANSKFVTKLDINGDHLRYHINGVASSVTVSFATSAKILRSYDVRSTVTEPQGFATGLHAQFRFNSSNGLSDGGTYNGVLTFRAYGSGSDLSGGYPHQLGFTNNNNIWHRNGKSATEWGDWVKILDAANYSSILDQRYLTLDEFKKYFELVPKDGETYIHAFKTIASDGDIQAFGHDGQSSGGGVSVDLLRSWDGQFNPETFALGAELGVDLNGRLKTVENTYLTRSDAAATYQPKGNYLTAITKAQVEAVLTGTISSHTHTFASLASRPNTLAGYGIADAYNKTESDMRYAACHAYNFTNGCLVKLNVVDTASAMITVHIIGNSYRTTVPIDTTVQFYNYPSSDSIVNGTAIHNGFDFGSIDVFNYGGYVYMWFKQPSNYQSFSITAYYTNSGTRDNKVSGITNEAIPATGVTRRVTIVPKVTALTSNLTDGSVTRIGTATVGAATRPIYLNGGVPTACSYVFGNASGNAALNNGTLNTNLNADKLDGLHADDIRQRAISFERYLGTSTAGGYDLDTLLQNGGMTYNYGGVSYWANGPKDMSYGSAILLKAYGQPYLYGMMAWDINHNSPTDITRKLYWRAYSGHSTAEYAGWGNWHEIAFTDSTVANASALGGIAASSYLHTGNYAATLDTRYIKKAGDTVTGALYLGGSYANIFANGTLGAWLQYGSQYINVKDSGLYHNNKYMIWDSGNDGADSGLDADLLDGYHESVFVRDRQIGSKLDYQHVVILLWKDSEIARHRLTGMLFTTQAGSTRHQVVEMDLWFSRWTAGYDRNFRFDPYGQNVMMKLVTCTYNGEKWWGIQHTNTQACVFWFTGTSEAVTPQLVHYYTSNTSTVVNAEVNDSIEDQTAQTNGFALSQTSRMVFTSNSRAELYNGNSALGLATGGLLVSSNYSDWANVPTNGIYSKGGIRTLGTIYADGNIRSTTSLTAAPAGLPMITIGAQNASYVHFSATAKFYFNQDIELNGNLIPYNWDAAKPNLNLGTASRNWHTAYIKNGVFSELKIGSATLTYDAATDTLRIDKTVVSEGDLQAFGYDSAGGGNNPFNIMTSWDQSQAIDTNALSARLGYALYTDIISLKNGAAVNVVTSGSGNAVTAVTKNGTQINVVKGATFLTAHQSLDGYFYAPEKIFAGHLFSNSTPNGYKIVTKWPAANGNGMPTINIRGYAYGIYTNIDLDVVLYQYNDSLHNYGVVSKGGWNPDIYATKENGFVVLYIAEGIYYAQLQVYVYRGQNINKSYIKDWTITALDELPDLSGMTLLTKRKIDNTVSNAEKLGGVAAASYALASSYYTKTESDNKYAKLASPNNLIHSGNEFTFIPDGFNGGIWFNYRAGANGTGTVTRYIFGDGNHAYAPIIASKFIRGGGTAAQFLKADGSVDTNTYLTTGSAADTYVKKSGDTMTGGLTAAFVARTGGTASQFLMADGSVKALSDITSAYVTALGTNGNYLTWTKNGVVSNITVPFATNATNAVNATNATNADKVDNFHAGYTNGTVAVFTIFPTYNELVAGGYMEEDPARSVTPFIKGLLRWVADNHQGHTLIGAVSPNSTGYIHLHVYNSGKGSDGKGGTDNGADGLMPMHCSGVYYSLTGTQYVFGTYKGVWYEQGQYNGNASTATKLAATRKLWGQNFNGSADVTGAMTGASRLYGTATAATYLQQSVIPTALGKLGTAIGIGLAPGSYGTYIWGEGNGNGYIQVGRSDGTASAYNLILQRFGGKVGIGTIAPTELLEVNGTAKVTTLKIGTVTLTDGGGYLKVDKTVSSDGDIQAFGADATQGGTGAVFDMLTKWSDYSDDKADGYALSAGLGHDLYQTLAGKADIVTLSNYLKVSDAKSTYVSAVAINGDHLRVTKNGVNSDLTISYSAAAGAMKVFDIRNTTKLPNTQKPYGVSAWFNNVDKPGTSPWYSGLNILGWEAAYASWQIAANATSTIADTNLYFRVGVGTTWEAWQTILTSANYASVLDTRYYTKTESDNKDSLKVIACRNETQLLWSQVRSTSAPMTMRAFDVYGAAAGGPTTYGNVLEIVGLSGHWQPQLWFDNGKTGSLRHRNKTYGDDTWGDWFTVLDTNNYASILNNVYLGKTAQAADSAKLGGVALDKFVYGTHTTGTTDMGSELADTIRRSGFYRANSDSKPMIIHCSHSSSTYAFQLGTTYSNSALYLRHLINSEWTDWVQLLDTSNYANTLDARYYTEAEINAKLTNGSVTKLGTATVGSTIKPIYLSSGTPVASTSTVGSSTKPMYMNAGTLTACSATVGASNLPVYMNAGTITQVSSIGEAFISWGGKSFAGSFAPLDAGLNSALGANRFAGADPSGITVQYTTDGTTWADYGATDAQKRYLTLPGNTNLLTVGKGTSASATAALRITFDAALCLIYSEIKKLMVYVSTNGSTACKVKVERATKGAPSTWVDAGTYDLSGWSGWNVINLAAFTFGYSNDTHYQYLRLTFTHGGNTTAYAGLGVYNIFGFGGVGWTTPSMLAKTGRLYTIDSHLGARFPSTVTAPTFSGALNGNATTATTASVATKLQTARTINGTNFDGSANITTAKWGTARSFAISDHSLSNTGGEVNVDGSGPVILKMPSVAEFTTLTASSNITASGSIGTNQTDGASGKGIFLYAGSGNVLSYGILFGLTSSYGKHGAVSGDWATYLTMSGATNRGWVFRHASNGCVASISAAGAVTAASLNLSGDLQVGGAAALNTITAASAELSSVLRLRTTGATAYTTFEAAANGNVNIRTHNGTLSSSIGAFNVAQTRLDLFNLYVGTSLTLDGVVNGDIKMQGTAKLWLDCDNGVYVRYNRSTGVIEASHTISSMGDIQAFGSTTGGANVVRIAIPDAEFAGTKNVEIPTDATEVTITINGDGAVCTFVLTGDTSLVDVIRITVCDNGIGGSDWKYNGKTITIPSGGMKTMALMRFGLRISLVG